MQNNKLQKFIYKALQNKRIWHLILYSLGRISRLFQKLENIHNSPEDGTFQRKCSQTFSLLKVMNGPFEGMKYPSRASVGSAFYPKILGSYEKELHEKILFIIKQQYTSIVNIGCAEGYYAVGLAMRCRKSKIYAFDTNRNAIRLCNEMAMLNQVDIELYSYCDKQALLNLELGTKALILCDCEGYENSLFNADMVDSLKQHDFLIETHDFIDIETTRYIYTLLSQTHYIEIIESVDDIIKAYNYDYIQLNNYNLSERFKLLSEGRPRTMRWLFAVTRN